MYEQSSDSSVTRATLAEGRIILNKDTAPTQTTAAALGINTDLNQANEQVAQVKDVKSQIQEQQQIATAIGHVKSAVEIYTSNRQDEAEQDVKDLKAKLKTAEAQGNEEAKNQLQAEILLAEEKAQSWGTGGSTKLAIDALTNAGLIALSGGSAQSIATAAASPYIRLKMPPRITQHSTSQRISYGVQWKQS